MRPCGRTKVFQYINQKEKSMNKSTGKKRIAVIAGDGIGKEVMPEGIRVLEAAADKFGIDLQFDHFDFSSWDYCEKHGKMMPDDWKDQIGGHDAIYFGAVGWPAKVPDHVSLWGSLVLFRREFDQYINLRPARLMPGIICPVVRRDGSRREPGEIDMLIVRENTEGEYSSIGGRMFPGTEREIVMQETVMSRIGVDRVLKFAFELAQSRPKKHLTSATKSKGIANTIGQIWCGALMLDFLGHRDAHDAVLKAIEKVLDPASGAPRTPDLGGSASTSDVGRAIAGAL